MNFLKLILSAIFLIVMSTQSLYAEPSKKKNPLIDAEGFLVSATDSLQDRRQKRISEEQFIEMAKDKNTIVLDTRSKEKYQEMHIKNARHLNFSDITKDSLAKVIPSKKTRVLIYCNNNIANAPQAFPAKSASMALNIPTFITLKKYGYQNVYELAPLIDISKAKIQFVGEKVGK